MRTYLTTTFVAICILTGFAIQAQDKKAPDKLTFASKMGTVTFDHAAHAKRANADCKTCHPSLFQQSSTAPLNFKAGMHKPAETAKTSCGNCHHPDGAAFETKGNCARCHVKG